MSFTVYDGIEAYARKANSGLYLGCRTSIFNDPSNQIYTPKGKVTRVRQYESGMPGNYSKTKGWMTTYGTGKGVQWIEYKAPYDRAKILATDAIDEEQSFAVGMTPSFELLGSDFLNNQLPREIDATNIAKWFSQIPADNKFTNAQMDISPENILNTLTELENMVFDSGYDRDIVLFMSSDAYSNMVTAIQNKSGFASNVVLKDFATVEIDSGLGGLISGASSAISVNINFERYGHFLIIKMPKDRMYSNIIMYSGNPEDVGQEAGGYTADTTNANFCQIKLMAIPIEAAFTNVRYMIDNFLYPAYLQSNSYTRVDIRELNKRMYGNVEINNAGINQKANAFEYDIRAIYGGSLFDNRARNCFAVSTAPGAQNIPVNRIELNTTGGNEVKVGDTLQIVPTVYPAGATNKTVTYTSSDEEVATVTAAGVITGVAEGSAKITGAASDDSGVTGTLDVDVVGE